MTTRATVLFVLAAAAIGCGESSSTGSEPAVGGTSVPPEVRLEASTPLPAPIILTAGPDSSNADLYRTRGQEGELERLTEAGRISVVAEAGGQVVVSNARGLGADRVEVPDLARDGDALPGRVISEDAQVPQLGPDGQLLFLVPRRSADGEPAGADVMVADSLDATPRRAYRTRDDMVTAAFGPDGALFVAEPDRDVLLRDPGTPEEERVPTGLPSIGGVAGADDGDVVAGARDATTYALISADGGKRQRVDNGWTVQDWSREHGVLVSRGERELGLLDPLTGAVESLGRITGGVLSQALFLEEGS